MIDPKEILHAELGRRYDLKDILGEGGMGTVYLAVDSRHGRRVAIKTVHPRLTSEIGQGTTFHFTAEHGISAVARETKLSAYDSLNGMRVLVVDDNYTNRRVLEELLRYWNLAPTCVESGPQALEELRRATQAQAPIPLVLLT